MVQAAKSKTSNRKALTKEVLDAFEQRLRARQREDEMFKFDLELARRKPDALSIRLYQSDVLDLIDLARRGLCQSNGERE